MEKSTAQRPVGERLAGLSARYPVDENLTLGLDVGIASVGSAVVRSGANSEILFVGSRCFRPPEEPKTRKPTSAVRRKSRLSRRTTRRRARRMAAIRALLVEEQLLASADPAHVHHRKGCDSLDPWRLRAEALDRRLDDEELAAALLHVAKHRGFQSNRKGSGSHEADSGDAKKMRSGVRENRELLSRSRYRTVGEMVARDEKFASSKRNRAGESARTHSRGALESEVREIFRAQRRWGNVRAGSDLEDRYVGIAFHQRPLQDSESRVGFCPFETDERRCSRYAPSFERFRFLSKLNIVRLVDEGGNLRRLTAEERREAFTGFGLSAKSLSWNALAKKIGQSSGTVFEGVNGERAKKNVVRSGGCAAGTKTLCDALGPGGWALVDSTPARFDAVASVVSFREDLDRIEEGLVPLLIDLDSRYLDRLLGAVRAGTFDFFKGAGHVSSKAARAILPHLQEGQVYSQVCASAGYAHWGSRRVGIEDLGSPVVQRSLREAVKQVETLVHQFGVRPGRIVVELAREVGKSSEERGKIERGMNRRRKERERHRGELKELLDLREPPNDESLRRYELWKEQNDRCIYTDDSIAPDALLSSNVEVDHVLPRSRSHDHAYVNVVLCLAGANREKGNRTPWEWKGRDPDWWAAFEARVETLEIKGRKKRNLLIRDFADRAGGFVRRNLNDTRYASRALLGTLRDLYSNENEPDPSGDRYLEGSTRRLVARSGAITALLRRAWGLSDLKDRSDDRHHALDALVCASARSEWVIQELTRQYQRLEKEHRSRWTPTVQCPWESFRDDARRAYAGVFVSRSEKRKGRGEGYKATIYRSSYRDGEKRTFERKAVGDLKVADLSRLKDRTGGSLPVRKALEAWFERGRPADDPPRSPGGDAIRKVRLQRTRSSGFDLKNDPRRGHVDHSRMVRVDVFSKPNRRGQDAFYLVPVYVHQVMNPSNWPEPPDRAIVGAKPEAEWIRMDAGYLFRFSLYPDVYVTLIKHNGERIEGYFRHAHRSTGALSLSPHHRRGELRSIGARTLRSFRKCVVDRLGDRHEVVAEKRTWHGVVCP